MCILLILALPLTLIEYYFTRERVIEETQDEVQQAVPMGKQFKALVSAVGIKRHVYIFFRFASSSVILGI